MANGVLSSASAPISKPAMDWEHLSGDIEGITQKVCRYLGKSLALLTIPAAIATYYGRTYLPVNLETSINSFYSLRRLIVVSGALGVIGIMLWYFNRLTVTPAELLQQRNEVQAKIETTPLATLRKEYPHPAVISNQELNSWARHFLETQSYEDFNAFQKYFLTLDLELETLNLFQKKYYASLLIKHPRCNLVYEVKTNDSKPVPLQLVDENSVLSLLNVPPMIGPVERSPQADRSNPISAPDIEILPIDMNLPRDELRNKLRDRWTLMTLKEILATDRQCFLESMKDQAGNPPLFSPQQWTQKAKEETKYMSVAEIIRDYRPLFEAGVLNSDTKLREDLKDEMTNVITYADLMKIYGSAIFDLNLVESNSSKIQFLLADFVYHHAEAYLDGALKEPTFMKDCMGSRLRELIQDKKEVQRIALQNCKDTIDRMAISKSYTPQERDKFLAENAVEVHRLETRCKRTCEDNLKRFKEQIWEVYF